VPRLERALRNGLEPRILMFAQRTDATTRPTIGHRNKDPRTINLRLRSLLATTPLDLPRRPRQHCRREIDVDRRVRHPLLQELPIDNPLSVTENGVLDT